MESELRDLLHRHAAFWRGEGEAALECVSSYAPLEDRGGIPLADGSCAADGQTITPPLLEPSSFYPDSPPDLIDGDFLNGLEPPGMCWTEAAVGCPVRIVTGGPWADRYVQDLQALPLPRVDAVWLRKLDEFVDFLVALSAGKLPIVQPLFRGPIDMMAAAVGHGEMCLCFLEQRERAHRFLDACSEVFVEAATRRLARTPPFHGGYLSAFGIWAPGPVVRTQLDNATLISPEFYAEHVLPFDRKVFEVFEHTIIHVHSGCLHIADHLVAEPALDVIQISIDHPGGPLAAEVMPILAAIVKEKPLIVTGPVSEYELAELRSLEPSGRLCLKVAVVTPEQARAEGLVRPGPTE